MSEIMLKRNIIVIDGPSECGKTSLCLHLVNQFKANYYHVNRIHEDVLGYFNSILDTVFTDIENWDSSFIIERFHVGEEVYARIYGYTCPLDWRNFDAGLKTRCENNNIKYTSIVTLPFDESVVPESEHKLYMTYKDLYEGNTNLMYNYDYITDPDYTEIDKFILGE